MRLLWCISTLPVDKNKLRAIKGERVDPLFTLRDACDDINNSGPGLQTALWLTRPFKIFLATVVIMAPWCAPTDCLIGSPLGTEQRTPLHPPLPTAAN